MTGIACAASATLGRLSYRLWADSTSSVSTSMRLFEAIIEDHFHRQFNINVLGLLLTTQAAVKYLEDGGSKINISSVTSRIAPNSAVYGGTNGTVDAITGALT